MTEVSPRKLLKTGFCLLGSAALDPIAFTQKVLHGVRLEMCAQPINSL